MRGAWHPFSVNQRGARGDWRICAALRRACDDGRAWWRRESDEIEDPILRAFIVAALPVFLEGQPTYRDNRDIYLSRRM